MSIAFLSLGSNIDDRKFYLDKALELLNQNEEINILKISSIYETKPVGYTQQDDFLNLVVEIKTNLEPLSLLDYCHYIEKSLNRIRVIRWGPRTIDVDILLYDDLIVDSDILTLPHPRMKERGFVLVPLKELYNDMKILNQDINDFINKLDLSSIKKVKF